MSPELLSSLGRLRFSHPTPIQASALPHILDGHDAICKAPTGSGKTLAFGIPIYEHFLRTTQSRISSSSKMNSAHKHFPIALILSPTRELAHQLSDHLSQLSSNQTSHPLGIATLTGGMSVHKQQRLLATADVIIGTPGRLWEIMQNSSDMKQSLKSIRFLVLDEADRLLSSGHFQEVEEILNALDQSNAEEEGEDEGVRESQDKEQRQTLVFSATFQKDLQQRLAGKSKSSSTDTTRQQSMEYLLKRLNFREPKPRFIDVNPVSQMALGLKEGIVECAGTEKVRIEPVFSGLVARPKLTNAGSVSLLLASPPPSHSNSDLYKFNHLSPTTHSTPPESIPSCICSPLSDAHEGSLALSRALLHALLIKHSCGDRRRSSRLRYSFRSVGCSLPPSKGSRHVRAPIRPDSPRGEVRLKHLAVRSRGDPRCSSPHCQGSCT